MVAINTKIVLTVLLYGPILRSSLDAICHIWVDIVYVGQACMTCHLMTSDTSRWSLGLEIAIVSCHYFTLTRPSSLKESQASHAQPVLAATGAQAVIFNLTSFDAATFPSGVWCFCVETGSIGVWVMMARIVSGIGSLMTAVLAPTIQRITAI